MMTDTFKQKIHLQFAELLKEKISMLQKNSAGLKEMGANETKSTAGDKHETALAMLQIEQENLRKQLEETITLQNLLSKINPAQVHSKIGIGSLIKTNHGTFYLSAALGKTIVENTTVIAISPQSPLGSRLSGLSAGAQIQINQFNYFLSEVL
jgi:hypothetical protein